jgi:hypothetical protein
MRPPPAFPLHILRSAFHHNACAHDNRVHVSQNDAHMRRRHVREQMRQSRSGAFLFCTCLPTNFPYNFSAVTCPTNVAAMRPMCASWRSTRVVIITAKRSTVSARTLCAMVRPTVKMATMRKTV